MRPHYRVNFGGLCFACSVFLSRAIRGFSLSSVVPFIAHRGRRLHPFASYTPICFTPCKGIWIPESGKFFGKLLLVESAILGFGIRNTAQGIRNPLTIRIQNSSSTDKKSECSTRNQESTALNPGSKTVLDFLTQGR